MKNFMTFTFRFTGHLRLRFIVLVVIFQCSLTCRQGNLYIRIALITKSFSISISQSVKHTTYTHNNRQARQPRHRIRQEPPSRAQQLSHQEKILYLLPSYQYSAIIFRFIVCQVRRYEYQFTVPRVVAHTHSTSLSFVLCGTTG